MPGVGTQLLFLLLLTTVVTARPAGTTEKLIESARRKARFGDYSFLCDLLCETAEDTESDCSILDWMSFDICDSICENSGSTATTTPKTVPTPSTAKTTERGNGSPVTSQSPTTPPTTALSTSSEPVTAVPSDSPTKSSPPGMTTPKPVDSTPSAKNPTASETTPKPVNSSPTAKDPAASPTTSQPVDSSTPTTKDPTASETTPPSVDSTPAAKDADLVGSPNEVDIITVNLEGNSSSAQLESQETSDKAVSWQEFKTRLMPYLPELIKLWCEWREIFSNPTSTSALERLCPPVSNESAKPSLIFNSIAKTP